MREQGKWNAILYKPTAGIFDLWKRSGLKARIGLGDGYQWPPHDKTAAGVAGSHSSPGRLLVIAARLLRRSKQLLDSAASVEDCVHGATLALDAQELLGNRTPTTALEALALKQELEVSAECMFLGLQYTLAVESRFQDLQADVESVAQWFRPKTRETSSLNAQLRVMNRLVVRLREWNQFDEENACMNKMRRLHRQIMSERQGIWGWLIRPFRWYVETLLGSMKLFIAAICFWVVVLSASYYAVADPADPQPVWQRTLAWGMTAFFSMQPPTDIDDLLGKPTIAITLIAMPIGFVHLGIFVSHLYSLVARK